jgi:hypothetical protein
VCQLFLQDAIAIRENRFDIQQGTTQLLCMIHLQMSSSFRLLNIMSTAIFRITQHGMKDIDGNLVFRASCVLNGNHCRPFGTRT